MRTLIGILALGALITGVWLVNHYARSQDGKSMLNVAGEPEVQVETALPERRDLIRTVQAPGEVEAFAEVDIRSELVAKILEMPVEEGDAVKANDLLCRLDDAAYARVLSAEANVAKLRAMIKQAEADLSTAERDWDQAQRLRDVRASSEHELANFQAALIGAQAVVEMRRQELIETEAALRSAREDLAKTVIRSPLDGVVSQRFAKKGEVVITGTMNNPGTRIMVVSDLSRMQVRCRVDEADAPLVTPGQPARIYLQSDTHRSIAGEVLRAGTKGTRPLGRDVVTFETLVLITGHDPRVKPGMTANVEVEVARREKTLAIPVQAVVYRKHRDLPEDLARAYDAQRSAERQNLAEYVRLVFCVRDGKAFPRLVETGVSDATGVEITSGLPDEDTVVIGPYRSLDQLKSGAVVKRIDKTGSAAPGTPAVAQAPTSQPTSAPASAPADAVAVRTTSRPADDTP